MCSQYFAGENKNGLYTTCVDMNRIVVYEKASENHNLDFFRVLGLYLIMLQFLFSQAKKGFHVCIFKATPSSIETRIMSLL